MLLIAKDLCLLILPHLTNQVPTRHAAAARVHAAHAMRGAAKRPPSPNGR
jgi:hypothetical protein